MKWLVYGCGLLISSAALVALSMSGVFPALGGIGSGLLTVCVYFLGVYLAPRLIIIAFSSVFRKRSPKILLPLSQIVSPSAAMSSAISWLYLSLFVQRFSLLSDAAVRPPKSMAYRLSWKSNIVTVMKKAMQMPKVPLMKAAMMPGVKMATAPAMPTEMLLAAVQSCLLITMSCASSAMVPVSSRKKAIVITTMAAITLQGASIGYTTPSWQNIKAILPALIVGKMGF